MSPGQHLRTADYDFHLPADLIAQHPPAVRDQSRLMVVDRATQTIGHQTFQDIRALVPPEGLVVLNDTKVIPARFYASDRKAELLLLTQKDATTWKCLVRPGRRFTPGQTVAFGDLNATVLSVEPDGERLIGFNRVLDFTEHGEMPLPPYITRLPDKDDFIRYQTVYASKPGAIAAPTAGLHFTPAILASFRHTFITLHIGLGTFRPMKTEILTDHLIHQEEFDISPEAAEMINSSERVLAVGTTVVRTLETMANDKGVITPGNGSTSLFIYPGFTFRRTNILLTNFHLPKSTLLALVAAFAGRDLIMEAYAQAVKERYRFFSYGDCMLVL